MANKVVTEREVEVQKVNVSAAVELAEAYLYVKHMATEDVSTTVKEADVKKDVPSAPVLPVEDLMNMAAKDASATGEKTDVREEDSSAATAVPVEEITKTATEDVAVVGKVVDVKMEDYSAVPDLTKMVTEILCLTPVPTADLTRMTAEDISATDREADVIKENASVTPVLPRTHLTDMAHEDVTASEERHICEEIGHLCCT